MGWSSGQDRFEGSHLAKDRSRGPEDRKREDRSRALPQSHREVQRGVETECVEDIAMAGFGGAMGSEEIRAYRRLESRGDESRDRGDVAVQHDGALHRGGAQGRAGQATDLETADLSEGRDGIGGSDASSRSRDDPPFLGKRAV
jgi:hypothetical protein